MGDTLDGRPRLLSWSGVNGGDAIAPDGTEYRIQSECPYGTDRVYYFEIRRPGEQRFTGDESALGVGGIEDAWRDDEFGPTGRASTARNRAERHAREFHAGVVG